MPDGVIVNAPDGSAMLIRYSDFLPTPAPPQVWGDCFSAFIAPDNVNRWLSGYFNGEVQLRWAGVDKTRSVKQYSYVPPGALAVFLT